MSSKKIEEYHRRKRVAPAGCFESSFAKRDDDDGGPKRQARFGALHSDVGERPQRKAARTHHPEPTNKQNADFFSEVMSDQTQMQPGGFYAPLEIPSASASTPNPLLQLILSERSTVDAFASSGAASLMARRASDQQQYNLDQTTMRRRILESLQQSQHLQGMRPSLFLQSQQQQPASASLQTITPSPLRQLLQSTQPQHQQRLQVMQGSLFDPSSLLLGTSTLPESSSVNNALSCVLLEHLLRQSQAAASPSSAFHQQSVLQQQQLLLQQLAGIGGGNLHQPQGAGVLGNRFATAAASITGSAGLQQQLPQSLLDSLLQYQQQSPRAQLMQACHAGQEQAPTYPQQQQKQKQKTLAANQQPVSKSKGIPLALPCDINHLSGYQIFIRHQLEFFVAEKSDCDTNVQGRKKRVKLSQIGIRCRHCAHTPLCQRGRGSVYYPQKLSGVYQAAQNMATTHLASSCLCIAEQSRQELSILHQRKDTASQGKAFWADACRWMGMTEDDDGIHFVSDEARQRALAEDFEVDD